MIVECSTLEQIKEVVRINKINTGWCDYDMLQSLKHFGTICVKINGCHGFSFKEFYEENYKDTPIISYYEYVNSLNKPKLSVSLKIQPDGKTVVYECTHIDEELRGKGLLAKIAGYEIKSFGFAWIHDNGLFVRGNEVEKDYMLSSHVFESQEQAEKFIEIMNELIDEINNPMIEIDVNESGEYSVGEFKCSVDVQRGFTELCISNDIWLVKQVTISAKGQSFSETKEEFDRFFGRRGIKARLIGCD